MREFFYIDDPTIGACKTMAAQFHKGHGFEFDELINIAWIGHRVKTNQKYQNEKHRQNLMFFNMRMGILDEIRNWSYRRYTNKGIKITPKFERIENLDICYHDRVEYLVDNSVYCHQLMKNAGLTDGEKHAIQQRYFHDKTLVEIAEEVGVNGSNISQRIHRGLRKVQKMCEEEKYEQKS